MAADEEDNFSLSDQESDWSKKRALFKYSSGRMSHRILDRKLMRQGDSDDSCNSNNTDYHCSSSFSPPAYSGFGGSFQNFTLATSRQPVSLINLAAAHHSPKEQSRYSRPPMVKNHTIDDSMIKLLYSSNDNLTDFGKNAVKTLYNYGAKKFVKQKSNADLWNNDQENRVISPTDGNNNFNQNINNNNNNSKRPMSTLPSSISFSTPQGAKFATKKRQLLERTKNSMKCLLDLFGAVEHDDIGHVKNVLQNKTIDLNFSNADNFTLLDVALMLNHNEIAALLLKHGAQESGKLGTLSCRLKHIQTLIDTNQNRLIELTFQRKQSGSPKNIDKQISSIESRIHMYKKMKTNLESSNAPLPPKNVSLHVSSQSSLMISLDENFADQSTSSTAIVTKYKVEWSINRNFDPIEGCTIVKDLRRPNTIVNNLTTGQTYFVRISAGNLGGFGDFTLTEPEFAIPSSWKDAESTVVRMTGPNRLSSVSSLFYDLNNFRNSNEFQKLICPTETRKKKSSIKEYLFPSSTKFQKGLKRGIYLASIFYTDDKILTTVDDGLPIVEIDDIVPNTLTQDHLWLMKLSSAWDDVKTLLQAEKDQAQRSQSFAFRSKLLESVTNMQSILGTNDIGRLHYTPVMDNRGVTLLVTVEHVQDPKSIQNASTKWTNITKLYKKQAALAVVEKQINVSDVLMMNLLNILNYYGSTFVPLDKGLYLCYVKLHSTTNQINIVVPENLPSVLPFFYIRDNPHVSKEEWDWLQKLESGECDNSQPTPTQLAFHWSLSSAAQILLGDLQVGRQETADHRIFTRELVEVHPDVTFILLLPPNNDVCSAPGHQWAGQEEKRGCFALPVPVFELTHLCTYQPDFVALYSKVSIFLELYTIIVQQMQRQTLNAQESAQYKPYLDQLSQFQTRLDEIWRSARWISAVATSGRDRQISCGPALSSLIDYSLAAPRTNGRHSLKPEGGANSAPCSPVQTPSSAKRQSSDDVDSSSSEKMDNGHLSRVRTSPLSLEESSRSVSDTAASDQGNEDNSDIGYHSDISNGKPASVESVNRATAAPTMALDGAVGYANLQDVVHSDFGTFDPGPFGARASAEPPPYDAIYLNEPLMTTASASTTLRPSTLRRDPAATPRRPVKPSTSVAPALPPGRHFGSNFAESSRSFVRMTADKKRRLSSACPAPDDNEEIVNSCREYVNILNTANWSTKTNENFYDELLPMKHDIGYSVLESGHEQDRPSSSSSASSKFSTASVPVCPNRKKANFDSRKSSLAVSDAIAPTLPSTSYRSITSVSLDLPRPTRKISCPQRAVSACFSDQDEVVRKMSTGNLIFATSQLGKGPTTTEGTLKIYAAYPCGFPKGTCVRLKINCRTTTKQILRLVIKHFNDSAIKTEEVENNSYPIDPFLKKCKYTENDVHLFCLVVVIGARERCLRDDYPPLELQNPWSKGKLFVRLKNDILAALEFGNEAKV